MGGLNLSAAFGKNSAPSLLVGEGQGAVLTGNLKGAGPMANAPLCVFSRVTAHQDRQFLGVAMTGSAGDFNFAIGAGPSREVSAIYRPGQRELSASATLLTRVRPTFTLRRKTIHNKGVAVFKGSLPGPDNAGVVVVLQVEDGKHWRVFRRYRTHAGGTFVMRYRFTQTTTPTTYRMRAQVPEQDAYSYSGGNSRSLPLRVLP